MGPCPWQICTLFHEPLNPEPVRSCRSLRAFCATFFRVTGEDEVTHIPEEGTSCGLSWEAGEVCSRCFPKDSRCILEPSREARPGCLLLTPRVVSGPFKGKDWLALGSQAETEEGILEVQASKPSG